MEAHPLNLSRVPLARLLHLSRYPASLLTLLLGAVAMLGNNVAAQEPATPVAIARETLSQWVATKRIISEEREAWRRGKQTMASQMDVVRREIDALNARIEAAKSGIADAEKKFGELEAERAARKLVSKSLVERIASLEERTRQLLPRVPAPLAENVAPISQRLPANEEQREKLSLSARYQNVIGVLNAIDKWNRAVTLKSELRELSSGRTVEVSVLYMGLGQGYYVGAPGKDGKATIAGVGIASPTGWTWREANDLAPAIQRAVSIYKNEGLASLVRLPVQIR
jgi:hypothetical protein